MPAAIPVVAAIAGTTLFGTVTVGTVFTTVALSAGAYLLNKALAPKAPSFGAQGFTDQGQKLVSREAVPSKRMILGRALVGGSLFFLEVKPPFVYYGIVLASHEIDGVEEFRVGNIIVPLDNAGAAKSEPFNDGSKAFYEASVRLGTDDQAIDPILAADFTELPATFRQRGHATVVVKARYGDTDDQHTELWGSGDPQFSFLVRGAKVYDPRDPSQDPSDRSTWVWNDTASLCQAYWLTSPLGGNRDISKLDLDSLCKAAVSDDESVPLASGLTEKRYTVNGVITTAVEPHQALNDLLTANLGRLTWNQGLYSFQSGVPRDPVLTLNDRTVRGNVTARRNQARQDLVNEVQTVFTAPERNYQLANGPIVSNAQYQADDGEVHQITVQLPFTATHTRAQRIAKAIMEMSRRGRQVVREEFAGDAILLSAGDVVNLDSDAMPFLAGTYELANAKLLPDASMRITYEEYSNDVWAWDGPSEEQSFTISPAELDGVN